MKTLGVALFMTVAAAAAANIPVIQPKDLADWIRAKGQKPELIHVGYHVMYRGKRIPKSIYAGPGSSAAGVNALRAAVSMLPRTREIVVYCGCCPWDHCPNIQPAIAALRAMGFLQVKALYLPTNITVDWFNKGYPSEPGEAARRPQ